MTTAPHSRWLSADTLLRICLILVLAVYARTVFFDFVWDDHAIIMCPWFHSWSGVKPIFTQHSWAWNDATGAVGRHYRPLFLLWILVVRMTLGVGPGFFHVASLLTHVFAVVLAFSLAKRLLNNDLSAAVTAIVFALHPSKVEPVAWISAATESLVSCFMFAALLAYIRARESERWRTLWIVATFACSMFALLTKENAVVLPALMLAYEWLLARRERRISLQTSAALLVPSIAAFIAFFALRFRILHGLGEATSSAPLAQNLLTAPLAFWLLVRQIAWPVHMAELYPQASVAAFSVTRFLLPLLAITAVALFYWRWARKSAVLQFAAAWLALTLAPVVLEFNWVQLHDRHLYLPMFAVGIMLAVALSEFPWPADWNVAAAQFAAAVALALVMAAVSAVEVRVWDNDVSVFARSVEVCPTNTDAVTRLATAYLDEGEYDAAVDVLQRGLKLSPHSRYLTYSLGDLYFKRQMYDKAYDSLRYFDNSDEPYTLYQLGMTEVRLNLRDGAVKHLSRAAQISPKTVGYKSALATAEAMPH